MAFSKTSVFVVENTVYVLTGGAIREKISVFENIRIRVGGRCKHRKNLCFRKYPDMCGRGLKQGEP